jgi:phytol kinase
VTIHLGFGMLLVGGSFAALIAGLHALRAAGAANPELLRKLLHIGMGVVSLSLPWLFDTPWPVLVMAGLFGLGLLGGRFSPMWRRIADGIVYGVRRNSFGDLCFPVAIAALFLVSARDPVTFYIPILTMTLADAAAALVGTRRGAHGFRRPGREKSIEGSVAFFIVALPCAYLPLRLWSEGGWIVMLLLSLTLALLATFVEALSWNGLDNLTVPLAVFLLLRMLRGCDIAYVMACLALTAGVMTVLACRCARGTGTSSAASEVVHEPL